MASLTDPVAGKRVPDELVLTRLQTRAVIERAARGLPWFENLTVGELRRFAIELNLDRAALERALVDVIGPPSVGRSIRTWIARQVAKLRGAMNRFRG